MATKQWVLVHVTYGYPEALEVTGGDILAAISVSGIEPDKIINAFCVEIKGE